MNCLPDYISFQIQIHTTATVGLRIGPLTIKIPSKIQFSRAIVHHVAEVMACCQSQLINGVIRILAHRIVGEVFTSGFVIVNI